MWGHKKPREAPDITLARLEALERRIIELEAMAEHQKLDRMEKELQLAQAMGKAVRALNAREAKRAKHREENGGEVPDSVGGLDDRYPAPSRPPDTAHLAQRFRRF